MNLTVAIVRSLWLAYGVAGGSGACAEPWSKGGRSVSSEKVANDSGREPERKHADGESLSDGRVSSRPDSTVAKDSGPWLDPELEGVPPVTPEMRPSMAEAANLRDALDSTLAMVDDATKIVGKEIPGWVEDWAGRNGLDVQRSNLAPPGKLYILGAVEVQR